ncbi:MAG: ATP-grasp domain-containing protein [Prevotella sp.]|nr:ATP-grasp domain-containing protein [Prevotella sp.]
MSQTTPDNTPQRPLAIVTGKNYASRLGMVRAAGMAGCDVVVVQTQLKWMKDTPIDIYSKYVVETKVAHQPDGQLIMDTIMGYKGKRKTMFILPTDDWTASLIDTHLDILSPHFITPHVNHQQGAILRIMDKMHQKELARAAGANVAEGWLCRYAEGGHYIPEGITYPCFTKPVECYTGALKPFLKRCDNREQLEETLRAIAKYKKDILVEEYHPITNEYAVLGVAFGNSSIMPAFIQLDSDREGVAATGRVRPISQLSGIADVLERFMEKTQFTGLFDIDLYESEGKVFFNELNARFGASGYAVTKGVVNLPGVFISYFLKDLKDPKDLKDLKDLDASDNFPVQSFANEKTCFDMLYAGMLNYWQYKRSINKADIRFIKDDDDLGPSRMASKDERLLFLRSIVWSIRNKSRK